MMSYFILKVATVYWRPVCKVKIKAKNNKKFEVNKINALFRYSPVRKQANEINWIDGPR